MDAQCRNVKGLTVDGQQLLQAMMDKGMLIVREVMNDKLAQNEKTTPACQNDIPGNAGDNDCVDRKTDGTSCGRDGQCLSGACGGCFNAVGWCYTPRSKAYGQTCKSDRECTTDRCSADCYLNPTGSCLCDSDSPCGANQFCGWGLNSGKCVNKRARGAACSSDRECASGTCRWSFTCK
ncbi:dickkopf-related protein [Corallococcus sp. AS-1-6]|uniref:dickkopf-related protein n=1 Tax=Corallococcus sp. AS-1-6 TaxID=2874599 RepID=UPI00359FA4D1